MNQIEKIEYIDSKLPYGYEILIRNNRTSRSFDHEHKWFVHVFAENGEDTTNEVTLYKNKDYYRMFGDNLSNMLDEAIQVVNDMEFCEVI